MRSIAFADFLIGLGILFVLEGLLFAASPAWMRRGMKRALAPPDNILRAVAAGARNVPPACLRRHPVRAHCGFKWRPVFSRREIEYDRCDSSLESSPAPAIGGDLPWRRQRRDIGAGLVGAGLRT